MAQDSQGGRSDSGRGGNRKRRYFRRKSGDSATQGDAPGDAPARSERPTRNAPNARDSVHGSRGEGQATRDPQGERAGRSGARRRRKSKGRRGGESGRNMPAAAQAQEIDYIPPTSVYIYTHVVRPSSSGAYEFRAEHFSKAGRTLDDYAIDVSPLFDEEARAAARPNMAEIFVDFDMGEEPGPPAQVEHMGDSLPAAGRGATPPSHAEDAYGAEGAAPLDENARISAPDSAPDNMPDSMIE